VHGLKFVCGREGAADTRQQVRSAGQCSWQDGRWGWLLTRRVEVLCSSGSRQRGEAGTTTGLAGAGGAGAGGGGAAQRGAHPGSGGPARQSGAARRRPGPSTPPRPLQRRQGSRGLGRAGWGVRGGLGGVESGAGWSVGQPAATPTPASPLPAHPPAARGRPAWRRWRSGAGGWMPARCGRRCTAPSECTSPGTGARAGPAVWGPMRGTRGCRLLQKQGWR
jgi:hypothetical protein